MENEIIEDQPELETEVEQIENPVETVEEEMPKVVSRSAWQSEIEKRVAAETRLQDFQDRQPKEKVEEKDEDPMPNPTDYEGREIEFARDIGRWDSRQTARVEFKKLQDKADAKKQEEESGKQVQDAGNNYRTQLDAEIASDPTLKAKISALPDTPLTNGRDYFLAKHVNAGKIVKHFANNPADFTKYATLPVEEALILLGEISSQYKTAQVKKVTNAPALHEEIEGGAGGKTTGYKVGDGPQAFLDAFYG